ncbi:MAG: ATP-grasp domain-containing protein, partial [Bdellovibrionota bacterium]
MRLGIATCSEKPAITAADLLAAERTGAEIIPVPWDLPNPPPVDALVIRSTWGYHHNLPRFESWLKNLKMPVLNPVPLMLGNLNKRYLLDLEKAGVPIVPTLFFREVPPRLPWKDVVLKPAVSASSHLTFRLSEGIEEAAKKILLRSEGLAQPFVKEIVEQGEISAIYHKEKGASPRLSHAIIKRPATGDFRVQAEFGG